MRFDHTVRFWNESEEHYVPGKGYVGSKTQVAVTPANITDVGTSRSAEVFGDVRTANKVVRLLSPVSDGWSYLTIDGSETEYVVVTKRDVMHGTTLIVGERHG